MNHFLILEQQWRIKCNILDGLLLASEYHKVVLNVYCMGQFLWQHCLCLRLFFRQMVSITFRTRWDIVRDNATLFQKIANNVNFTKIHVQRNDCFWNALQWKLMNGMAVNLLIINGEFREIIGGLLQPLIKPTIECESFFCVSNSNHWVFLILKYR